MPVTDAFTGTDGTALPTYSANWATLCSGGVNDAVIFGNGVRGGGGNYGGRWVGRTWSADQYSQAVVSNVDVANEIVVVVRGQAVPFTLYGAGALGNGLGHLRYGIYKRIAGIYTQLALHGSQVMVNGDTIKLMIVGSSLSLYVNGSLLLGPVTDTDIATGEPGLFVMQFTAAAKQLDDWEGDDIVSGSTITGLGRRHMGFVYARPVL